MIKNHDRSSWFGASDTNIIMSNWDTKTFAYWWLEKLGLVNNNFTNLYMLTGTYYEHRILDYIGVCKKDRQIKNYLYRARINLDGETNKKIYECKTHKSSEFKLSLAYWQQAQVQCYFAKKPVEIVAYKLLEEDYQNFFNNIDAQRISFHKIDFDKNFIQNYYMPRLKYLAFCLRKRKTPILHEVDNG